MRRGHRVWSGVLLALATVIVILGITAVWVQRQVLDREEFVDTSVELLENDDVRRAIGLYLIDELYTNVDVAGEIQSALPERIQPLARAGRRRAAPRSRAERGHAARHLPRAEHLAARERARARRRSSGWSSTTNQAR